MTRRLFALGATLALAFGLMLPSAVLATGSACIDNFPQQYHTWSGVHKEILDPSNVNGVHADLFVPAANGDFSSCGAPYSGNDGSLAWVAIEPGPDNAYYGNFNSIIQIGIINCDGLGSQCDNTNHYFWASGGCGSPPAVADLGPAVAGSHRFSAVRQGSSGNWNISLFIDGVRQKKIPYSNAEVACWVGSNKRGDLAVERWDRGDSAGTFTISESRRVQFNNMEYSTNGGGTWLDLETFTCYNTYPSGVGSKYECQASINHPQYGDFVHIDTYN